MDVPSSNVLIIYTGGTIGMKPTEQGLMPAKDFFKDQLERLHQFHDRSQPSLTTPISRFGKRVHYEILEWDELLDSSNMDMEHWIHMINDIEENYSKYNAFIIVHGTDTMAHTASALSFMIDNLSKPIIITGSQVPIANDPNDASQNLLGALTIAGHFEIPEVCVYFGNKLMRGNRVTKIDSLGFDAYSSPNEQPLVKVGTDVNISWNLVRIPNINSEVVFHRNLDLNVGVLKLFPGMTGQIVHNFLQPPLRGCVIETYGTGNAPTKSIDMLKAINDACDRGVIIVNVSQCLRGFVNDSPYATGTALSKCGVISGMDMTTEAALSKLSYLLGLGLPTDEIRRKMKKNLRGELTGSTGKIKYSWREDHLVRTIIKVLNTADDGDLKDPEIKKALQPFLLAIAANDLSMQNIKELVEKGVDIDVCGDDMKTTLHLACIKGNVEAVKYLLSNGANFKCKDKVGKSPLDYALLYKHENIVDEINKFQENNSNNLIIQSDLYRETSL